MYGTVAIIDFPKIPSFVKRTPSLVSGCAYARLIRRCPGRKQPLGCSKDTVCELPWYSSSTAVLCVCMYTVHNCWVLDGVASTPANTGGHGNQDQICLVQIPVCIVFCVYDGSRLLWSRYRKRTSVGQGLLEDEQRGIFKHFLLFKYYSRVVGAYPK